MNDSIRRWNEENHVSEKISAALESVAQVTQHVFDSIFPSATVPSATVPPATVPPESTGPVSDEVYADLPIASPVSVSPSASSGIPSGDGSTHLNGTSVNPSSIPNTVPSQATGIPEPVHPMYEQHDTSRANEIDLIVFSNNPGPREIHTKHCTSNNEIQEPIPKNQVPTKSIRLLENGIDSPKK